ncbi:hypothetical protein PLANPX_5786 [Lacipirellula parvula]|uniref:Uncharacterized protein n=1 Tax=Lacipirellula parvula TaxID=2650471 RepID=A0A5K7XH00_9BACT|nr:hypothetical protein PLANPX_5786 [Lacipirellula parvula]
MVRVFFIVEILCASAPLRETILSQEDLTQRRRGAKEIQE